MSEDAAQPWLKFFPPPADASRSARLSFRLICRKGEPLLLLPARPRFAEASLSLYPAQTRKARLARRILAALLRCGLHPGTTPVILDVELQSPFAQFLSGHRASDNTLQFAMLAGNARAPGRRFVFLVFDERGEPRHLVKAGLGGEASDRVRRETAFLKSAPGQITHAPEVRGEFAEGDVAALAMEYIGGPPARPGDLSHLTGLLSHWLDRSRTARFADLPASQRFSAVVGSRPEAQPILAGLREVQMHPAIFHGDLAPWNIRLDPASNRWRVFDWERGEQVGPPGWDWFHFTLQPAILVQRLSVDKLVEHVAQTLRSPEFLNYAQQAGITTHARQLFLAYLLYCRDVQQQTEGSQQIEQLFARLSASC
jgi:hypothetical protein